MFYFCIPLYSAVRPIVYGVGAMKKVGLAPLSLVQRNEENWVHLAVASGLSSGQGTQNFRMPSVFEHKVRSWDLRCIDTEEVTILFWTRLETSALSNLLTGRILILQASQFEPQFGNLTLQGGIMLTSHLNALSCFLNVFWFRFKNFNLKRGCSLGLVIFPHSLSSSSSVFLPFSGQTSVHFAITGQTTDEAGCPR